MTQVYKKRVSLQEFSNLVRKIEYGGVGKIIHLHSYGSAKLKNGEYVFLGKLLKHETLSEALPKIEELYGEHQFSLEPYMIRDDELAELLETKKLLEEIGMRTDIRVIPLTKKKIILEYVGIDSYSLSTENIDEITSLLLALSVHSYKR